MQIREQIWHAIAVLLVALIVVQQITSAFPIPRPHEWSEEDNRPSAAGDERPSRRQLEQQQQQPPDKCPRNLCKGRICEVICKNNPSEGGKFCNCDTYALRGTGPSYTDCNRLL